MDTISLNQALFIMALARNDVRERIVQRFMHLVQTELPQAEWDFRRSSELYPHKTRMHLPFTNRARIEQNTLERVFLNAQQRYHFRNVRSFFENDSNWCGAGIIQLASFDGGMTDPNTMNSMQRTFLRLAQIFKSQMVAEVELKQRVIERALIEDERSESFEQEDRLRQSLRTEVLEVRKRAQKTQLEATQRVTVVVIELAKQIADYDRFLYHTNALKKYLGEEQQQLMRAIAMEDEVQQEQLRSFLSKAQDDFRTWLQDYEKSSARNIPAPYAERIREALRKSSAVFVQHVEKVQALEEIDVRTVTGFYQQRLKDLDQVIEDLERARAILEKIKSLFERFDESLDFTVSWDRDKWLDVVERYSALDQELQTAFPDPSHPLRAKCDSAWTQVKSYYTISRQLAHLDQLLVSTRQPLNHRKLLDFLIDEREEKHIELLEGTRSYIAAVDQYLKRLSTALEDDFKVQLYDPAFTLVRAAAREHSVTLGQVERTTLLMNNRAIAIVKPSATMEFDLPKRDIVIVEALEGAKALAQDYGALLNDPTFLAAFQLMGGAQQPSVIKSLYPSLGTTTDQQVMGLTSPEAQQNASALQGLVPEPAIYKFETGTGFEIRPVIQPDGDSVVYDFNYMYTTNVREPVRADEKHLGRIKRHFIDTQVQTSSFELREISRYQVALKAARTSRGVPLLEDIPGIGVLFRPLPSAESSLQQNIILGQSTVYPTLFDLMGLRWARHVVDLDHLALRDTEHVVRGRNTSIEDFVFDQSSGFVDTFMNIPKDSPHYRPDLYHRQRQPSPYHPGGYIYRPGSIEDPTGEDFRIRDARPMDMRGDPPYDDRFRRPYQFDQLQVVPESSSGGERPSARGSEGGGQWYEQRAIPELNEPGAGLMYHRSYENPVQPATFIQPLEPSGHGANRNTRRLPGIGTP